MRHTLESHSFFPIVAWVLILSFALFTYTVIAHVQKELAHIGDNVERLERQVEGLGTDSPRD